MANIHETITEVEKLNPELARQIQKYVKDHSYGLVFESNLPEAVRLYKKTVCVGDVVHMLPPRGQFDTAENYLPWIVKSVQDGLAVIQHDDESREVPVEDVVVIVSWHDVIYPGLKEIDRIERGASDDPYHMIINAENYHALEALTYAYAGKVDCIYIDPPYNKKEAKDWKYNCNYIDANDQYRHSKWLTFMERRLKLAKQLLDPNDSVLIVTIDEVEYARLGLLLEQMFPEANIQMISSVINASGVARDNDFYRTDEYIYILRFGDCRPARLDLSDDWLTANTTGKDKLRWRRIRRQGSHDTREDAPNQFYPIYISEDGTHLIGTGRSLAPNESKENYITQNDCMVIWPLKPDGTEGCWQISQDSIKQLQSKGYIKVTYTKKWGYTPQYLAKGERAKVESGQFPIVGYDEYGTIITEDAIEEAAFVPGTQWRIPSHNAREQGAKMLRKIFTEKRFDFPKSLYAVHDVIRFFVEEKPDALIVDFFSGSGTTLHAVNLLNAEDGGRRRCICVTNNEVSETEEKRLIEKGLRPSDPDWEKYGIAHYVTWPRTKCTIEGTNIKGSSLSGNYIGSEIPMSSGFKANAIFCELTYESAWPIRLDNAFDAIAPILWMQAGCRGPIIKRIGKSYLKTDYYGVLFDYNQASKFCEKVKNTPTIKTVFIVTDDQRRYSNMCRRLPGVEVHRLYETYLRTFEICGEGGAD